MKDYPLLRALTERRSRRFGMGMKIPAGPLTYQSRHAPAALSENEEGALAFAACGVTGPALADLAYGADQGSNIMAGLVGRTIASGDAIQTVSLVVINDTGAWFVKRPQDLPAADVQGLMSLARDAAFTDIYHRTRVRLTDKRVAPPTRPLFNININRWSLHAPGSSYFLPINDLTFMYINGLLEIFNEHTGVYALDERAGFRPAGVAKFARSRGGHLDDDPRHGLVATVKLIEQLVTEFVTVEQGMLLQNLGLMTEALGLGGFSHFACHEFAWFQELGFNMGTLPASKFLGVRGLPAIAMRLLNRDLPVPVPLGLEREGQVLLRAFCPPYFPSMADAVQAVVAAKFGPDGVFRRPVSHSSWREPAGVIGGVPAVSAAAIDATTAYCEYLWKRYGRFPVHVSPFRTVLGFQAVHVDAEFYDRFYKPEALSERQRADYRKHAGGT